MISYVENALKNGQYRLLCQYVGVSAEDLGRLLVNNKVMAYEFPKSQLLESAWNFRLYFAGGEILAFSSKCTSVGGWDEVGSLSIELIKNIAVSKAGAFIKTNVEQFCVVSYSMLVYEKGNVYSETGIEFLDDEGMGLIIVAGPSPGSVSVSIPGILSELKPEFSISEYRRV